MSSLKDDIMQFGREMEFSPNTAATYHYGLNAFLAFVTAQYGEPDVDRLDDNCLVAFYRWMTSSRGRGYSDRTAGVYLSAARRFLIWLDAQQRLPSAFSLSRAEHRLAVHLGRRGRRGYQHRPMDERLPEIVTYYDDLPLPSFNSDSAPRSKIIQQRLILLRTRALMHVLYATAARISEVITLTRQQVQDGRAEEVLISGKGGRQRILFFSPDARAAIRAYLAERHDRNPWLFVPHQGKGVGHISRLTAWMAVKHAVRALDLSDATSPHTFRHYRATQLLNNGMPLESVQALLGHTDIGTTRTIYASTHTATLRQQLEEYSISAREAAKALSSQQDEK